MKGSNTLKLNQSEMIEAMTLYLKTRMFTETYMANAEVKSVEQSGGNYDKGWTVELGEVESKSGTPVA